MKTISHLQTHNEQVPIRLADHEFGWAVPTNDPAVYRLECISIDTELTWGDWVRVNKLNGHLEVSGLVTSFYPVKECIFFDTPEHYQAFERILNGIGAVCELYHDPEPDKGLRGSILVAMPAGYNAVMIAVGVGIPDPETIFSRIGTT